VLSPDRQGQLKAEAAGGPMRAIAIAQVQQVRVKAGSRELLITPGANGWVTEPVLAGPASQIDTALNLLRNSPEERRFEAQSPEFGLQAPLITVRVFTRASGLQAPALEVDFGVANPIGLARYARVSLAASAASNQAPTEQWLLLPAYVAEAWERLLPAP
jgi:hypothetical protein